MNHTRWYIMDFKRSFKIFSGLLLAVLVFSCEQREERASLGSISGPAFGTTFNIKYFVSGDFDSERFTAGIDSVLNAVNVSMSTYLPQSDITRINQGDTTVVVDEMFKEVFVLSRRIQKESEGYFDPTIGVLRNAYGFGDTKPLAIIDEVTLDSLMTFVGFSKVSLKEDGTVYKEHPEIYFDFNAIAKGYGIDRLGVYFDQLGITNYLIELGGEILTKGQNLNREGPWTTGIEAVDSERTNRSYEALVSLQDVAMASSGNYRKFRIDTTTGKRYVHTLNPLTGSAETSDVTSATVIAATCAEADAYATTFMALGLERSKILLNKLKGVEAYLTYTAGDSTGVYISDGFKPLLLEQN